MFASKFFSVKIMYFSAVYQLLTLTDISPNRLPKSLKISLFFNASLMSTAAKKKRAIII